MSEPEQPPDTRTERKQSGASMRIVLVLVAAGLLLFLWWLRRE